MNKDKKICLVVKCFLKNPTFSAQQLSMLPELEGFSRSSIQRYLKDPLINEMFDEDTYNKIQELLKLNHLSAQKKGGITSFLNNQSIKDGNGKFMGSVRHLNNRKLEVKCKHILSFANIFLAYPEMSLQEIADFYNKSNSDNEMVTRDYVYDCLKSKKQYDVLSEQIWAQIETQLENRRLIGNQNGANITNQRKQ